MNIKRTVEISEHNHLVDMILDKWLFYWIHKQADNWICDNMIFKIPLLVSEKQYVIMVY